MGSLAGAQVARILISVALFVCGTDGGPRIWYFGFGMGKTCKTWMFSCCSSLEQVYHLDGTSQGIQ